MPRYALKIDLSEIERQQLERWRRAGKTEKRAGPGTGGGARDRVSAGCGRGCGSSPAEAGLLAELNTVSD